MGRRAAKPLSREWAKGFGAVLLVLFLSVPAFADPGPARRSELTELVAQDCGSCHGLTRAGGLGAPLTAAALADLSEEAVAYTILEGRPGTPMPPWKSMLSEPEAVWIARLLKEGHAGAR
ncbi:MAG: cytochrome c [Magnetospirillum sp.]|nr:cytochrome c [Magnetospirillum sp.]